jgi:hypothetical protein
VTSPIAPTPAAPRAAPTDEQTLVRREVDRVLGRSEAWKNLPDNERRSFALNMAKVAAYLTEDPGWLDAHTPPEAEGMAEALGPVDDLKKRLAEKPGQVGAEFEAGAMRQGVEEFGNLVKTVDFPEFVSGLIQGVFQAIVDASIQQMEAYGELLAATAKTVEQFASDHISDDQAREQIANKFPSIVRMERTRDGGNRLAPATEDAETGPLQQYARTTETIDFEDEESERKFLAAAKLEMARGRQKLMALMVMLGINRIVVTNGRINAKVVFDIRASDYAKRKAKAGLVDREAQESGAAGGFHMPWGGGGGYAKSSHTATVRSSVEDESESKAVMKAQLTGEVRVNFKSETLSPDRMLDKLQYEQMNYLAGPGVAPGAPRGGAPGAPAPAGGPPAPAGRPPAPANPPPAGGG